MAASTLDLLIEQGTTWSYVLKLTDPEGAAVDLTAATAKMQVRDKAGGFILVVELSTDNSRIAIDGAQGTITLNLTDGETRGLKGGTYAYDLELTQGSTVTRLVQGRVVVSPEVTV